MISQGLVAFVDAMQGWLEIMAVAFISHVGAMSDARKRLCVWVSAHVILS
jgi:hypothetical protein